MTFTRTSQKFGQWSDVKNNTVYGLGFSSEGDLSKVSSHYYYYYFTSHMEYLLYFIFLLIYNFFMFFLFFLFC